MVERTVFGVPVRVTPAFFFFAVLGGANAGRSVHDSPIVRERPLPPMPPVTDTEAFTAYLDRAFASIPREHASLGWVLAAGVGVALAWVLSIALHELGHYLAARLARADVGAIVLHFAGGHVEVLGGIAPLRFAAIVAAGPLVSAVLAAASWLALALLGLPSSASGLALAGGQVLFYAALVNTVALAINLLPFPSLDGGQLVRAVRLAFRA
jgi:Zn-dependent protease